MRNESYHISIHETNKDNFAEICQKLQALDQGSQSVLLKNPWDTGNAKQILERFPNARFIYITRDPIFILNSQMNAFLTLITGSQPFQTMLVERFKAPGGKYRMAVFYGLWKSVRGIKAIFGDAIFSFFARPFTAHAV
ncbi:MAG: sulfotransferase [Pseudomonadales bacterium]|nr:sulfotransferase [Pseudomonadales bacterium]